MFTLISIFGNPHISKNWLLGEERQSKNNATLSTRSIGKASKYASSTNSRKVSPAIKTTNTYRIPVIKANIVVINRF